MAVPSWVIRGFPPLNVGSIFPEVVSRATSTAGLPFVSVAWPTRMIFPSGWSTSAFATEFCGDPWPNCSTRGLPAVNVGSRVPVSVSSTTATWLRPPTSALPAATMSPFCSTPTAFAEAELAPSTLLKGANDGSGAPLLVSCRIVKLLNGVSASPARTTAPSAGCKATALASIELPVPMLPRANTVAPPFQVGSTVPSAFRRSAANDSSPAPSVA